MHQSKYGRVEEDRLKAVREAFWNNTPEDYDIGPLHDTLVTLGLAQEPTIDQLKRFFMMLPANIIGPAVSWGLTDTEVRDRIHEFAQENEENLRQVINNEQGN